MKNITELAVILFGLSLLAVNVNAANGDIQEVDPETEALKKAEAKLVLQKKVEDAARELAISKLKNSELLLQEKANIDAQANKTNSEVLNETAKINAIKSIVGDTKAGKSGTITMGNEDLVIIPLGGKVDAEAFALVAEGICNNVAPHIKSGSLFVTTKDIALQGRMYGILYSDLVASISTAKSKVPTGIDLLQQYKDAVVSVDNKKQQKSEAKPSTKGVPAILSGLSILPNVANTIVDVTKIFRSDYVVSLRETSSGSSHMIGRIVAEPSCLNAGIEINGLTGIEPSIADAAVTIIRTRQEGELVKQTLTILAEELRTTLQDARMQTSQFFSLKNDITNFLVESGNLLKSMEQLTASTNLESTKQDSALWSTATRLAAYNFIKQSDVAILSLEATRHTNAIKKSSVFSSDQISKSVIVTVDYQLFNSSGKTIVMESTNEIAVENINQQFK